MPLLQLLLIWPCNDNFEGPIDQRPTTNELMTSEPMNNSKSVNRLANTQ